MIEYKTVIEHDYNAGITKEELVLLGREGWLLLTHTSFIGKSNSATHHYTFMQEKTSECSIPDITIECKHDQLESPIATKKSFFQKLFNYGA